LKALDLSLLLSLYQDKESKNELFDKAAGGFHSPLAKMFAISYDKANAPEEDIINFSYHNLKPSIGFCGE
jgi:hypothetical protein